MTLESIIQFIEQYRYWFLLVGSFIEGFNVMIIGGFMVSIGVVAFLPTVLILFLGDLLSDIMWYYIGFFGGEKTISWISNYYKAIHQHIEQIKEALNRHTGKILITVKLTSGLCIATILAAGITKINFKKFLFYDIIGSANWVLITVLIGYFSGSSYLLVSRYFKDAGYLVLAAIILLIIFINYLDKRKNFQNVKIEN
jgi:membrane protein DedA with SNARE-associated domain